MFCTTRSPLPNSSLRVLPKPRLQLLTAEDFTYNSFVSASLGGIPCKSLNLEILRMGGGG